MSKKTTHVLYESMDGEFMEYNSEKDALDYIAQLLTAGVFSLSDFTLFEVKHGYNLRIEVQGDKA